MPPDSGAEDSIYQAAKSGLQRWLSRARDVVMAPWRQYKAQPNPEAIAATVPLWQAEVDKILAAMTPAQQAGWAAANLPGTYEPNDPYIQANLALTKNLLVRIPDEVHAKVVAAILEGTNAGESMEQIANRVDNVLTYTGSENWDGRAHLIARTELTRHFAGSTLAHALLTEKNGNQSLMKEWDTTMDGKERRAHRFANSQVQPLNQPFIVDGIPMLFPGDPTAPPDLVCNCVPPWQLVSVRATALMKGRFSGMLVHLQTSEGHDLATTPDHPVLTRRGWMLAKFVQEGNQILSTTEARTATGPIDPDITYVETKVEEIVRAIDVVSHTSLPDGSAVVSEGMRATFVDFNDQVLNKEVDVVRADLPLTFGKNAQQLKQLTQFSIHGRNGEVSSTRDTSPSKGILETKIVGLGPRPDGQSQVPQDLYHSIAGDAQLRRDGKDRLSRVVEPVDVGVVQRSGLSRTAGTETLIPKSFSDRPRAGVELGGDLSHGLAPILMEISNLDSEVEALAGTWAWHRVSSRTEFFYSGAVYDFETVDGVFSAGGVVVSNCRCSLKILKG